MELSWEEKREEKIGGEEIPLGAGSSHDMRETTIENSISRKQHTVLILGRGKVGRTLAHCLEMHEASARSARGGEYDSVRVFIRSAQVDLEDAFKCGAPPDTLILTVPDSALAQVADALFAKGLIEPGTVILHCSGALVGSFIRGDGKSSIGVHVASIHPLQTFPNPLGSLSGIPFAIEGDSVGVEVARKLVLRVGGKPFYIKSRDKPAYHAAAVEFCNYLCSLLAAFYCDDNLDGSIRGKFLREMRNFCYSFTEFEGEREAELACAREDLTEHIVDKIVADAPNLGAALSPDATRENLLVVIGTLMDHALRTARLAGIKPSKAAEAFRLLIVSTVNNLKRDGPFVALTGPIVRGDGPTITAHRIVMEEQDPDLWEFYAFMAEWTIHVAQAGCRIDVGTAGKLRKALAPRWPTGH